MCPVFWNASLYADAALQIFFIGMGVFALLSWRNTEDSTVEIVRWSLRNVGYAAGGILLAGLTIGWFLSKTDAGGYAYFDSLIMVGSVVTTILTARKIYEGWWFWIVINCLATAIFALKGLEVTAWLYGLFFVLSIRAMIHWKKVLDAPKEPRAIS